MRTVYTILLIAFCAPSYAQIELWSGEWNGYLEISGIESPVRMNLKINPADSAGNWNWIISYDEGIGKIEKKFTLVKTDDESKYQLDENNSIRLDFHFFQNTFYSTFKVSNSLISTVYLLQDEKIFFTVFTSDLTGKVITGGNEETPEVESYPIINVQSAVLTKSN